MAVEFYSLVFPNIGEMSFSVAANRPESTLKD